MPHTILFDLYRIWVVDEKIWPRDDSSIFEAYLDDKA